MLSIVLVKLFGVAWITLTSAVGLWAPFLCVGQSGTGLRLSAYAEVGGGRLTGPRPAHIPSGQAFLSLANCFSAGMLLTMALLHFFPSALSLADDTMTPTLLSGWALAGVLIPALLEHGVAGAGGGGGAHSGGHGHSHGIFAHGGGGGGGEESLEERRKAKDPAERRTCFSTATLLVVLMCFHGMMEGLLLGLEQHVSSLLKAAVPLSIHRFFDGMVIGVSLAKEVLRSIRGDLGEAEMAGPAEDPPNGGSEAAAQRPCGDTPPKKQGFAVCGRRVWQPLVLLWLALTPVTMVAVLLLSSLHPLSLGEGYEEEGLATKAPSASPAARTSVKDNGPRLQWMAAAQALGSGSFVYLGLSIFIQEELKGLKADATMLFGVVFTMLLFVFSGSEH